jgi:hypothetical protein
VCSDTHLSRNRRRALGLVANAPSHPVSYFVDLFERAGFTAVTHEEITPHVVPSSVAHARKQIAENPTHLKKYGRLLQRVVHAFLDHSERTFAERESTYDLLVATVA